MRTAAIAGALCLAPTTSAFVSPCIFSSSKQGIAAAARPPVVASQHAVSMSHEGGSRSPVSRHSLLEGLTATLAASAAVIAANPAPAAAKPERIKGGGPVVTLEDGAQYQEMTIGDGPSPKDGDRVAVHYSLYYKGYTCGTINGPGSVPPGLDEIVKGMRVGGRRKLTLPPELAFGKAGRPPFIPGDATVQMDVSLWSVKPAGTDPNITLPGSSVF